MEPRNTGILDNKNNPVLEHQTVRCYNDAALDESWGLEKIHTGVIVFKDGIPYLKIGDIYLEHWYNAEQIEIV